MKTEINKLLIMPLGGLEQIGGNSMLIGLNGEWVMVDLGISFYNKYGIDILTPDISYPASIKENIKAIIITHAHEDHIGAIPYLWQQLRCPVYLTEFPAAVLKQKIAERPWKDQVQIHVIEPSEKVKLGEFEIEFVSLAHSILGACGIYIKTSKGSIFHTGDWKIDETPLLGKRTDEKRLAEIGDEGIDCLLCDSTNILTSKNIGSEADVQKGLRRVISQYPERRITVTCFASNLARIDTILQIAKETDRKIAIIGRSMHNMIEAIKQTSFYTNNFQIGLGLIVSDDEAASMPDSKVLILCTGSQGETRAALSKIARGENKGLKLGSNDIVLFSSKVIPGNELVIRDVQNQLVKQGVFVITTETEKDIHVSGHPNKAALEKMYTWLKPKSLMPIHGDARMIYAHRDFGIEKGIKETIIADSGDVITLSNGKLRKIDHKHLSVSAIDGHDLIPLTSPIIKARENMSFNGHVSLSVILEKNGAISSFPNIIISGIYIDHDNQKKLNKMINQVIQNEAKLHAKNISNLKKNIDLSIVRLIFRHFKKRPTVSVHIHEKNEA